MHIGLLAVDISYPHRTGIGEGEVLSGGKKKARLNHVSVGRTDKKEVMRTVHERCVTFHSAGVVFPSGSLFLRGTAVTGVSKPLSA